MSSDKSRLSRSNNGNTFMCNRCIQISTKWLLHAPSGYILLGAWQIQRCHLALYVNELKCAFPIHKRASPISTPCIRVRASKRELPTIAAHTVPSSTVNQGGVRVRAIVKVSNKFRCASRESRRVIRKIDFPRRASDVGSCQNLSVRLVF